MGGGAPPAPPGRRDAWVGGCAIGFGTTRWAATGALVTTSSSKACAGATTSAGNLGGASRSATVGGDEPMIGPPSLGRSGSDQGSSIPA
jgi:hypothetical protein